LANLRTDELKFGNPKIIQIRQLLHFFMRRMLPASATKLLELDAIRSRLPVLGGRVVPLFTVTAL
jgi:hypothetical protein